jgi:hypothetical protein
VIPVNDGGLGLVETLFSTAENNGIEIVYEAVLLDHLAEGVDDPGSPLNMVGRDVLRDKFRKLAGAVLPEECIEKLIAAVERLERSSDAAELVLLLVA